MTRGEAESVDARARRLGAIGHALGGDVTDAEHAAGRERFAIALDETAPTPRRWLVALAAAAALGGIVVASRLLFPSPIAYRVSGASTADGPWLGVAADQGSVALRFSEGSEVDLGPNSKGRVAELTARGAHVVLGSGHLQARVVHQPRTQWTVEAGPYAIEVTGTAFDVAWEERRLEVSLHDGSVIVRGPSFPSGVRVAAGQRLLARTEGGAVELTSLFAPEPVDTPPSTAPDPAPDTARPAETPRAASHTTPAWADLVAAGDFRAVLDAAEARGVEPALRESSVADLTALSDAARYSGNRRLARRALTAQRSRFGTSSEAHAAAFTLGRLADEEGSSAEALRWYDAYLAEAPHGTFAAEALGRRLVALSHTGTPEASRAAAKDYLGKYPDGAHAAYARELLSRP